MPVISAGISVGTTPVILVSPTPNPKFVYVQAGNADALVHVGGSDVSAANGVLLSATNNTVFQLNGDDTLFAISDTADTPVKVLQVK